ncbi:MAG: hypothetical protein JOS17DRAFT_204716 [Linnemannia elongata]|nr:MAG: hypothetical protein JOS17DRAFT_204716 [Linnemannia elongata]
MSSVFSCLFCFVWDWDRACDDMRRGGMWVDTESQDISFVVVGVVLSAIEIVTFQLHRDGQRGRRSSPQQPHRWLLLLRLFNRLLPLHLLCRIPHRQRGLLLTQQHPSPFSNPPHSITLLSIIDTYFLPYLLPSFLFSPSFACPCPVFPFCLFLFLELLSCSSPFPCPSSLSCPPHNPLTPVPFPSANQTIRYPEQPNER